MNDVTEHGTPAGYRQGCRGRGECDPAQPWTCGDAMVRYRGDLMYRRRVDADMSPHEIAAADAADVAADRQHVRDAARAERRALEQQARAEKRAAAAAAKRAANPNPVRATRTRLADPIERARAGAGLADRVGVYRPTYGADAHGTPAGYARGCRAADTDTCPSFLAGGKSCGQAHREYMAAWSAARKTRPIPADRHGTPYGYALGCRSDCPSTTITCSQARAADERDRRARRREKTTA